MSQISSQQKQAARFKAIEPPLTNKYIKKLKDIESDFKTQKYVSQSDCAWESISSRHAERVEKYDLIPIVHKQEIVVVKEPIAVDIDSIQNRHSETMKILEFEDSRFQLRNAKVRPIEDEAVELILQDYNDGRTIEYLTSKYKIGAQRMTKLLASKIEDYKNIAQLRKGFKK